ncbi:hypothetical protein [Sphingomonas sp.]|uniref:hypothetical protein n=1 Tax=Sphingomonas sp. TaxID=28214 RepID=UPI003B3AD895
MRTPVPLLALALALAIAGCRKAPQPEPETRPDWRGAAIEGIAPLMRPAEVQAALDRRGYRQIKCTTDKPLLANPLHHGDSSPCYQVPGGRTRISLYFLDLHEGRRLAVATFRQLRFDLSDEARIAASRAYAEQLQKRFGRPSTIIRQRDFTIIYWSRPGGRRTLPDQVVATIDRWSALDVELRSMWAYGQQRPRKE